MKLNEYIGGLVAHITEARTISDLKSLEVAEGFAKHDLLKHFSVPRFRVHNIEMDIPVGLVQGAIPKNQTATAAGFFDNRTFNAQAYKAIKKVLKTESLPKAVSAPILKSIADNSMRLEKDLQAGKEISASLGKLSKTVSMASTKTLQRFNKQLTPAVSSRIKKLPNLQAVLEQELRAELKPSIRPPKDPGGVENMDVIFEAHKLKEFKPDNIVRIKLTLAEEGMEWHTMQDESGESVSKLLPE